MKNIERSLTSSFYTYVKTRRQIKVPPPPHTHTHPPTHTHTHAHTHTDSSGVRQSHLVNWYLKELADEIESIGELAERKLLAEKVIERLVQHVSYC